MSHTQPRPRLTIDLHTEGWYFLRTPQKAFHSLISHPGSLAIRGAPYPLSQDEAISMVAKKQTAFTGIWEIEFEFEPQAREGAGVAVWWSKWCYGSLGVHGGKNGTELVFRIPDDGNGFIVSRSYGVANSRKLSFLRRHPR